MVSGFDKFFKEDKSKYNKYLSSDNSEIDRTNLEDYSRYEYKNGVHIKKDSFDSKEASIVFAGKILFDSAIHKAYKRENNYDQLFEHVSGLLRDSDLTFGKLSTLVARDYTLSGEFRPHLFEKESQINNAPIQFLDSIKKAGFDVLITSDEKSLELGALGVESTLKALSEKNIIHTGLFNEDHSRYLVFDINGIKVAVLSYNTKIKGSDKLNELGENVLINMYSTDRLLSDLASIQKLDVDYIIAFIDWTSISYNRRKALSSEIINNGVDAIIGASNYVNSIDFMANCDGHRSPVVYSMGKFIKGGRGGSLLVKLKLTKKDGKVLSELEYLPSHIFKELKGNKYVNVAVTCDKEILSDDQIVELKHSKNNLIKIARKNFKGLGFENYSIKLSKIYEILGIEFNQSHDKVYSRLNTLNSVAKNSVVILHDTDEVNDAAIQAITKGAGLIITPYELDDELPHIVYSDIEEAYVKLATYHRDICSKVRTTHVVSSVKGANRTRFINEILESRLNINTNSTIFSISDETEAYVKEISCIDESLVEPDYILIDSACGYSGSSTVITREESRSSELKNAIYYSIENEKSDYYATDIELKDTTLKYTINHNGEKEEIEIIVSKEFDVYNVVLDSMAAFIIADLHSITHKDIISAIKRHRLKKINKLLEQYNGAKFRVNLSCDSEEEIIESIKNLEFFHSDGRKIALLSDVPDARGYERVVSTIKDSNIDLLILFGNKVKSLHSKLVESTGDSLKYLYFDKYQELKDHFAKLITNGDIAIVLGNCSHELALLINELYGVIHSCMEAEEVLLTQDDSDFVYKDYGFSASICDAKVDNGMLILPEIIDGIKMKSVDVNAFTSDNSIESLDVANGYLNIMEKAFYENINLAEVKLPNSLKVIGRYAFSGCKKLNSIELPEGMYSIKKEAFSRCTNLKEITIPKSVNEIEGNIFRGVPRIDVSVYENSYAHKYFRRAKYYNIYLKII